MPHFMIILILTVSQFLRNMKPLRSCQDIEFIWVFLTDYGEIIH